MGGRCSVRAPKASRFGYALGTMLRVLALILIALWLLGVVVLKTVGTIIHLLLLLAVVVFLMAVLRGRGRRP